jgi:hypothetical protein
MATRVFRTDLDQPGFAAHDWARGKEGTPLRFRQFLVSLGQALGAVYQRRFGRPLTFFSLGRFDQQTTTAAHRDGAPDESILMLGYEPTSVASRLYLLDYTRAALDRGLRPAEFLERYNPLTPAGGQALSAYTTLAPDFEPSHYCVVVINNSSLPWELRQRGMLGVLHQADIPAPDATAHRYVNSLILTPVTAEDGAPGTTERISPEQVQAFVDSAATAAAATAGW